ncbi:MAG: hypothetical protein NW216_02695 [Hyphomicrobium sp.]|nr:hypothetical protein [Hyphomicrobium sp.]
MNARSRVTAVATAVIAGLLVGGAMVAAAAPLSQQLPVTASAQSSSSDVIEVRKGPRFRGLKHGKLHKHVHKWPKHHYKVYRGRRWHDGARWYYWAPWVGAYIVYNSYDTCYANCRDRGNGPSYCTDLCSP